MSRIYQRTAGSIVFLAAAQFIIAITIAQTGYPDYSVADTYIGDLGTGPTAIVFNASVVLLGLSILVSTYLIYLTFRNYPFVALFALTGLGAMGVGLFPATTGSIHLVSAFVAHLFGALSAIASFRLEKPPFTYCSVLMGIVSLVALVLFITNQYLGLGRGGMESMFV